MTSDNTNQMQQLLEAIAKHQIPSRNDSNGEQSPARSGLLERAWNDLSDAIASPARSSQSLLSNRSHSQTIHPPPRPSLSTSPPTTSALTAQNAAQDNTSTSPPTSTQPQSLTAQQNPTQPLSLQSQQQQTTRRAGGGRHITQEQIIVGHFCRHSIKLLSRIMQGKPNAAATETQLKDHIKSVWAQWVKSQITRPQLLESVATFVRQTCAEAQNVDVIHEFKAWYEREFELQRQRHAPAPSGGNPSAAVPNNAVATNPAAVPRQLPTQPKSDTQRTATADRCGESQLPAIEWHDLLTTETGQGKKLTEDQTFVGYFCRFAMLFVSRNSVDVSFHDMGVREENIRLHLKSSWKDFASGKMDRSLFLNNAINYIKLLCPETKHFDIEREFEVWYRQKHDLQKLNTTRVEA